MVLGNDYLIRVALTLSIICMSSCAQADISIDSEKQKCIATVSENKLKLQLSPPCELVKIDFEEHDYYQYGGSKVFIISGKPAPLEQLKKWSVTESDKCSLQSQAVIISGETVKLSSLRNNILVCPDIGLDEKIYRDFFE